MLTPHGPDGPACAGLPSAEQRRLDLTGRVASQWIAAFRFLGLASDDASFLEDYRSGLARAVTQQYAELEQRGEALRLPGRAEFQRAGGVYEAGPAWTNGFYDAENLYRLQRDTGDAPIGEPPLPPSRILAALARTVAVLGPGAEKGKAANPDAPWPRILAVTWTGPRIGGTFTTVEPKDRELYNPEKFGTVALLVRGGRQSGDPELIRAGDEMIRSILRRKEDVLPLCKIQGQTLTRLHAAVALPLGRAAGAAMRTPATFLHSARPALRKPQGRVERKWTERKTPGMQASGESLSIPLSPPGAPGPEESREETVTSAQDRARLLRGGALFGASQFLGMALGFGSGMVMVRVAEKPAVASYMLLQQAIMALGMALQLGLGPAALRFAPISRGQGGDRSTAVLRRRLFGAADRALGAGRAAARPRLARGRPQAGRPGAGEGHRVPAGGRRPLLLRHPGGQLPAVVPALQAVGAAHPPDSARPDPGRLPPPALHPAGQGSRGRCWPPSTSGRC